MSANTQASLVATAALDLDAQLEPHGDPASVPAHVEAAPLIEADSGRRVSCAEEGTYVADWVI